MLAVDTNIVVRYLMNDNTEQAARAKRFMDSNAVLLTATVVLETEWVLRSMYRLPAQSASAATRQFIGLPAVTLQEPAEVAQALDWFEQGMDFADALHLATAHDCTGLLTFDRDFIKSAARIGAGNVAEP